METDMVDFTKADPWRVFRIMAEFVDGFELMAKVILPGSARLAPNGLADGRLEGGLGALLASRDAVGTVRVLLVNRNTSARSAIVRMDGSPSEPSMLHLLDETDDPAQPLRQLTPAGSEITLPARSVVVVEF